MANLTTPLLTTTGLVGGFEVARRTKNRPLGGAVLAVCGIFATFIWVKKVGWPRALVLLGIYLGAFGYSHPLAKKVGAEEAVAIVTAASGLSALLFGGSKRSEAKVAAKREERKAARAHKAAQKKVAALSAK
ncbi:hypothetical protein [Pseudoglutamicibacter albus]|uniref:hypothetical protein n=1 Tax=Micrococcaceae TaxID=1268 RepID=UPI0008A4813C